MDQIENKQMGKQFVRYVVPAVIGMLVQALYVILDGVIVGQGIGEIALGAINVVFPFTMLVVAMSMLIGVGGANVYSFHKGKNEMEAANNIFCQCMVMALLVGMALSLGGFFFRAQISSLMGANNDVLPLAMRYLGWAAPFAVVQMVAFALAVFVRNDEAPKTVMLGSVFGAVINAVLDVIFILVLHQGIEVAAITNGIGAVIEFVFYISHFVRRKGLLRIRKPIFKADQVKRVLHNGMASAMMELSVPAVTLTFNLAVVRAAGTLGLSAYAIVSYVCSIMNMVMVGVTQGAQPLMSLYYGKGNRLAFKHAYRLGIKTNLIASVFLVGLSAVFGEAIVPLFHTGSQALTALTVHMMRVYPAAHIFIGISLMNILYFQTTEHNIHASFISLLRCVGFIQLFVLISALVFRYEGLYLAFALGELAHFVISYWMVKRQEKMTA